MKVFGNNFVRFFFLSLVSCSVMTKRHHHRRRHGHLRRLARLFQRHHFCFHNFKNCNRCVFVCECACVCVCVCVFCEVFTHSHVWTAFAYIPRYSFCIWFFAEFLASELSESHSDRSTTPSWHFEEQENSEPACKVLKCEKKKKDRHCLQIAQQKAGKLTLAKWCKETVAMAKIGNHSTLEFT